MNQPMDFDTVPTFDESIQMVQLRLIWVPPQQQQSHRPYEMSGRVDEFLSATKGGTYLSRGELSGIANGFMKPSFQPRDKVQIINGFNTPRYVFLLELVSPLYGMQGGDETVEIISGYTSHNHNDGGVHRVYGMDEVILSPDLRFHVNNRITYQRTITVGARNKTHFNVKSSEIFIPSTSLYDDGLFTLSPSDVLCAEETRYISKGGCRPVKTLDYRSGGVGTNIRASLYNSSNNYVSDLMRAYMRSGEFDGPGNFNEPNYDQRLAGTLVQLGDMTSIESSPVRTLFYRAIGQNDPMKSDSFTFRDIENRWGHSYVDSVTDTFLKPNNRSMYSPNDTQHWGGTDTATFIAYQLTQTIPYIMLENLLFELKLVITNQETMGGVSEVLILDYREIAEGFITRPILFGIEGRIMNDVVKGIVLHETNGERYHITMDAQLVSESEIRISLGGKAETIFIAPMFATSLASPQVATGPKYIDDIREAVMGATDTIMHASTPFSYSNPEQPATLPRFNDNGSSYQEPDGFFDNYDFPIRDSHSEIQNPFDTTTRTSRSNDSYFL
jgi:hypothetical protein